MQVCRVSARSRHRLPAPQTHTYSLLLCYTRPTHGVLVMKSLSCLLIMCWLSFLFLVCFPCHCIWSVGKCFISWGQSPSFLWARWLRLRLESALAVSCLGTWVMQRLGGCRRHSASHSHSHQLSQCLWTYRSFGELKSWLQIEKAKENQPELWSSKRVLEETKKPGECQWTGQGLAAKHRLSLPAEPLQRLPSFLNIFPGISLSRLMGTLTAMYKPLNREML